MREEFVHAIERKFPSASLGMTAPVGFANDQRRPTNDGFV
jgi:hypothetical protein